LKVEQRQISNWHSKNLKKTNQNFLQNFALKKKIFFKIFKKFK